MTYSDKHEFAAKVFAECAHRLDDPAAMLAQAQYDALPSMAVVGLWSLRVAEGLHVKHDLGLSPLDIIDAAYALAVKLAPLAGVEVQDGKP